MRNPYYSVLNINIFLPDNLTHMQQLDRENNQVYAWRLQPKLYKNLAYD